MRRFGVALGLCVLVCGLAFGGGGGTASSAASAGVRPLVSDYQLVGSAVAPPSQAACNAIGRRCFNPAAMAGSYDYASLHSAGDNGQGRTIAIFDAFGSSTIADDL